MFIFFLKSFLKFVLHVGFMKQLDIDTKKGWIKINCEGGCIELHKIRQVSNYLMSMSKKGSKSKSEAMSLDIFFVRLSPADTRKRVRKSKFSQNLLNKFIIFIFKA